MTAFRKTVARPAHRIDHRDSSTRAGDLKWWQRAVVYEIAPISFQDSDGDGKGDFRGLINRIDYLEWLGIDVVWLTPVFRSPMLDFGMTLPISATSTRFLAPSRSS